MNKDLGKWVLVGLLLAVGKANAAVLLVEGDELERNRRITTEISQYDGSGASIGVKSAQSAMTDMNGQVNRVFLYEAFQPKVISGMARDIPLEDAVKMVVPPDYNITYRISRQSQRMSVSWRGGVEWTVALRDLMNQSGGYAFVDPQTKKVVISPNSENDVWEVAVKDKTVQITLARWAAIAGYQLVWDIERDFNVDASTVLQGNFKDVVTELITSLSSSDYPVRANFYDKSKVLRIVKYTAGFRSQR